MKSTFGVLSSTELDPVTIQVNVKTLMSFNSAGSRP